MEKGLGLVFLYTPENTFFVNNSTHNPNPLRCEFDDVCVSLQLDSTVCKEMSVSDTEVSDMTWTDNGTFNLSEGHTPQTENSEGTSPLYPMSYRWIWFRLKTETQRHI